ncbi:MAG: hypothetical protein COU27_00325, partial [Candidatus Levybacteria bacterium CG10_big_fil_rev_8_21_14_0_10_36_7]
MHKNSFNKIEKTIPSTAIMAIMFLILPIFFFSLVAPYVSAQSVDELKKEIADFNAKIKALEAEISQYESQLNEIGSDKQTLQKAIKELDISRKKLLTNIQITQNQIYSTTLQIQELGEEIIDKKDRIENDTNAVASAIRGINEIESKSMIEAVLGYD